MLNQDNEPLRQVQAITVNQICREFGGGCSVTTLWRIRQSDPSFPSPFTLKQGGKPLFHREQIQAWYDSKRAEVAA